MSSNNNQIQQEISVTVLSYLNGNSLRGKTLEATSANLSLKLGLADLQVRKVLDDLIKRHELAVSSLSQYDCILQQSSNFIEVGIYPKIKSMQDLRTKSNFHPHSKIVPGNLKKSSKKVEAARRGGLLGADRASTW